LEWQESSQHLTAFPLAKNVKIFGSCSDKLQSRPKIGGMILL